MLLTPNKDLITIITLEIVMMIQNYRGIEESVDPNHETKDGDDAQSEEKKSHESEDLVVVQIDRQHAMTRVRQQVTVNLRLHARVCVCVFVNVKRNVRFFHHSHHYYFGRASTEIFYF